jgi:glutamyl-tRNA synthetase
VRGDDLLSSTPRQLAVYRAMGVPEPEFPLFAHLPFVLGLEGQKLGKRYGAASISYYRDEGFLPEAIDNYLALLGWSPGDNREEFTLGEMAAEFDLARVNKNPARFDVRKLEAINGDKIRQLDPVDFIQRILPFLQRAGLAGSPPSDSEAALAAAAAPLIQGRISKLTDAVGMLSFLLTDEGKFTVDEADAARSLGPDAVPALVAAHDTLARLTDWSHGAIKDVLQAALVDGLGLKPKNAFGGAVRVAVTGRRVGPPLFESMELLGRERTLKRLARAAEAAGGRG